jgi:5-formyltetrahydrofolate cyclo-ligase
MTIGPPCNQGSDLESLSRQKTSLRKRFQALRESLTPEEVRASSLAFCQQVADWPPLRQARTVLTYLAFRNELDTSLLFRLLPEMRWLVPRISGGNLVLHRYDPTHLVRHQFGMLEPDPHLPVVDPAAVDLVLTPGIAFDRRGSRLGFGGGFYDRFLPTTSALRVGVVYDTCLADELPASDNDQRVHWVVTPTQTLFCAPLWL